MNKVIMESDVDVGDIVYIEHTEQVIIQITSTRIMSNINGIVSETNYILKNNSIEILRKRNEFKTKQEYRDYLIDKVNELGENIC